MMWLAVIHIFLRSTFLVAGTKELNSFHSSRLPFGICRSFYKQLLLARLFDMRSVLPPRAIQGIFLYYGVLPRITLFDFRTFKGFRGFPNKRLTVSVDIFNQCLLSSISEHSGQPADRPASGAAGRAGADSDVIYNYIGL